MEWWQTLLLGVAGAAIPALLAWFLGRKGANKKLEIEEGALEVTQFEAQTKAYQDLLTRSNEAVKASNEAATAAYAAAGAANEAAAAARNELMQREEERQRLLKQVDDQGKEISSLSKADAFRVQELEQTNEKLENLRSLFERYVARVGVPMTHEEQQIFESTVPREVFRRIVDGT